MDEKFIITPKEDFLEDKSVTITIRIDRKLRDQFDALSSKSNRSRNELINRALQYAIDRVEFAVNND